MTEHEIASFKYWLELRGTPREVDEEHIRAKKKVYLAVLKADINKYEHIVQTNVDERIWKYLNFLITLNEWLQNA